FGSLIERFDWPRAFLIAACVTAGLTAIWAIHVPEGPGGAPDPAQTGVAPRETTRWRDLVTDRSLILLTLSYGAVGYFQYLFFYWMQYYFSSVLHVSKDQSRWFTTITLLTMAATMAAGGWASDIMQRRYGRALGRRIVPMGGMVLS